MSASGTGSMGFVNVTASVELGVATDRARERREGAFVWQAVKDGKYRLATTKCEPSMATMEGSPDHCWAGSSLGRPVRSLKVAPPSFEYPTPVSEPRRTVESWNRNPVASFQPTSTRFCEPDVTAAI